MIIYCPKISSILFCYATKFLTLSLNPKSGKMKNIKLLLIASTICLSSCQSVLDKDNSPVVATYNGGTITKNEVQTEIDKLIIKNNQLKGLTFDKLPSDKKELIVKEAVTKEILSTEAKALKLDQEEDYQKALKIFQTELLQQKIYAHLMKDAVTESKIQSLYQKVVNELKTKEEFNIRYMSLATKKEADQLYDRLKKHPQSFAYYAKNKSLDKNTAKNGGELGFVLEGTLPQPINAALKTMKKDDISKPIELQGKWVLVKLEETRKAKIPSYKDSQESLKKTLSIKAINEFTEQKLKGANINMTVK